jgi:hypothetical protein
MIRGILAIGVVAGRHHDASERVHSGALLSWVVSPTGKKAPVSEGAFGNWQRQRDTSQKKFCLRYYRVREIELFGNGFNLM